MGTWGSSSVLKYETIHISAILELSQKSKTTTFKVFKDTKVILYGLHS